MAIDHQDAIARILIQLVQSFRLFSFFIRGSTVRVHNYANMEHVCPARSAQTTFAAPTSGLCQRPSRRSLILYLEAVPSLKIGRTQIPTLEGSARNIYVKWIFSLWKLDSIRANWAVLVYDNPNLVYICPARSVQTTFPAPTYLPMALPEALTQISDFKSRSSVPSLKIGRTQIPTLVGSARNIYIKTKFLPLKARFYPCKLGPLQHKTCWLCQRHLHRHQIPLQSRLNPCKFRALLEAIPQASDLLEVETWFPSVLLGTNADITLNNNEFNILNLIISVS